VDPSSQVPMVGASGAIAGVLGAYVRLYPRARVVTLIPVFFFFFLRELPAGFFIFFWFLIQLFSGLGSLGAVGSETGGVAFFAHIGGFVAGFFLIRRMRRRRNPAYGWYRPNTIGATPQDNTCCDNWVRFWQQNRLQFQLDLAARNGAGGRLLSQGERLLVELPALFGSYLPEASLLHGDLWSGNYAYLQSGEPTLFDPAVYYGDREADLAMTELFGGFGADFYAAYNNAWPLDSGYRTRKTLYNLYHILNHYNMFGSGYLGQAQRMLDSLMSELR